MKSGTLRRAALVAAVAAMSVSAARVARATDVRLDVATYNNSGDDTAWFGDGQLVNLNFPSANGHVIAQGSAAHQGTLNAAGNALGVYYDTFHSLYSASETPQQAVSTIQGWIKQQFGGSAETGAWLVLNEVDSSTWNGSSGDAYRAWLVNTMGALNAAGYQHIVLYAENSLASKTYASTWQSIAKYAYIGDECYIDGPAVVADNFSVSKLQQTYQSSFNNWTSTTGGAGVPAAMVLEGEHFSVNQYAASNYWGADGISGTQWQMAIEARDLAIHNVPFGGFIGYAWDKDAQATGNPAVDLANQISYERAYASTLVTQTERPTWTGNDGTSSWNDYLNWTGGLPSTTADPFPLLAATNPGLPRQTMANFLGLQRPTTVTLDGDQSVTNLTFGTPYAVTIAPGTGGSLTIIGSGASITATMSTHVIAAPVVLGSNVAANLTGNLTLAGGVTNAGGYALSESGPGTLTIAGPQSYAAGSAITLAGGTLNLNSDVGSAGNAMLAVTAGANSIVFLNAPQHLSSLSLTDSYAAMQTRGRVLSTGPVTLTGRGTLDLGANDMIVDYAPGHSPLAAIESAVDSGYAQGAWNGHGIITSTAWTHPFVTLGVAEASQVLGLSGSATGTFDGETVDASSVLVKYTLVGDANLDGVVNAADLAMMQMGGTTWAQGDFNHDGVVNAADYTLFQQAEAYWAGANVNVLTPEPAVAGVAMLPLLMVRRRGKKR